MTSTIDHDHDHDHDHDLTGLIHEQMPFAHHLEIVAVAADQQAVVMAARWHPEFCGIGGVLHGGYLMAMADGVGATLAFVNLPQGASTTTIESKSNFFRPVTGGSVKATATIVHHGRSTIVVQTDITDEQGALVSRTVQTQAVRPA